MTLSFKLVTLINRSYIKRLCGAARSIQSNAIPSEKALPFESVPEVKGLPVVGTLFEVIGHRSHAHELATRRFRKYGPVFREKAGPMTLVHICDVSDIETMCRLEGPWPRRIAVPCWNEWRRNQKLASGILIAWVTSLLKSLTTQPFVQQLVQANNKVPQPWPFVRGIHQWTPSQRARVAESVSCNDVIMHGTPSNRCVSARKT